jgi:hypothetical protein
MGGLILAGAVAAAVACTLPIGCIEINIGSDCDLNLNCPSGPSGSTGTGAHDGGTGGSNPDCAGDPTTDPAIVTDACGVFVDASAAPGGDGKQASPFQTFAEAAAAKPARVFACAGTYTETMQVTFSDGVSIYGGFTGCTGKSWTWSASMQAQIATVADKPGMVLDGGANHVENVTVTAPGATMPGGSSIALLVNGGSLEMANGALTAGDAQDGAAGASLMPDSSLDGATGANGANACDPGVTHPGATGATNTCAATGGNSTAGSGGDGGDPMGAPAGTGTNGSSMPTATPSGTNDGKGGAGEAAVLCANGDNGAPGAAGNSGGGATGPGGISAKGYQGIDGAPGGNGAPGQGGGGGGGAKGAMSVTCGSTTASVPGASGGAGGTGGCGGAKGGGGQAGGSSIALLVLDADVTLSNVTLTAGKGGNGGGGGNGQDGGHGGNGGSKGNGTGSANDGCQGGAGGKGGAGGPGGGGQGGHSLGIAFQGITAPKGGTFMIDMTKKGTGGAGGMNNANMGTGADGVAANCWDFGKKAACKP